ncbi:hypothetical protein ABPG74_019950 [Tetrahymena malaccensis]
METETDYLLNQILDEREIKIHQFEQEEEYKSEYWNNLEVDDIQEQIQRQQEQLDALYKQQKKNYYLILGDTGVGKSSFIKKITENPDIQTSSGKSSHTQACQIFENEGMNYIDTPGINDTNRNSYEILLSIVKFLKSNNIILDNLFILLLQNGNLKSLIILRQFSYTYFLYELFGDDLKYQQVEILVKEYEKSGYLLNWSDAGFHYTIDELSDKRKLIFRDKHKASNYFEYIDAYYIRILTFFDLTAIGKLEEFDVYKTEFLKEQIWSDINQEDIFEEYNDYIKDQKAHLLNKIEQIMRLEFRNKSLDFQKDYQNILLIGKSQVGKSSLIEQLTNQKGLRGSGDQSQTKICTTYRIDYGNTIYRFIDTPGYAGSEENQNCFHNFKIIADYLYRSGIKDFKLLFMINKGTESREIIFNVLDEFFQFIAFIFDQDVSFIDRKYLEDFLSNKKENNLRKFLLKDKILQIFRKDNINRKKNDDDNVEFLQFTYFQSNYRTDKGNLKEVKQEQDNEQKMQLFIKINLIDSFTLDDKVTFRIKKSLLENIISSADELLCQFNQVAIKYQEKSELSQQISQIQQQGTDKLTELYNKRQSIIKFLNQVQFNVVLKAYQQLTDYVKILNFCDQVKNDALRHFLPIQQNPILFEITDQNSDSVLISKKQHHYSLYAHKLSKFVNIDNPEHRIKLENLAEINLSQELSFQQIEQSKSIEQNYQKKPEENIKNIKLLTSLLNYLNLKGIQSNQQYTYFSIALSSIQMFPITCLLQAELILSPLRVGYDFYQLYRGFISSQQFLFNLNINMLAVLCFIGINSLLVSGIVSGIVTGLGYLYSTLKYTSKATFDTTIGMCFKQIMNEASPNQSLKNYEIAQLLKQKFNFTNYSQLTDDKIGYEMFRQLEKQGSETQYYLTQLFQVRGNQNLKDEISKFIVENYILNEISQQIDIQQQDEEQNIDFLERSVKQLSKIQCLIQTFYYQSNYNKICDKSIDLMKKKLESEQKNQQQGKVNFSLNERQMLNIYKTDLKKFIQEYQKDITYDKCKQLASGKLRYDDRFEILFNSYCNLTYLKAQQKLKQPTIREIQKDIVNMKFKIAENCKLKQNSFIFNCKDDNQLIELINVMNMTNKYIHNRYLSQVQEKDQPNLTSLPENEIIEAKIQYSIDLHNLVICSQNEIDFVKKVEIELRKKLEELFKIGKEKDVGKYNCLKEKIDKKVSVLHYSDNNYRIRSFYQSVKFLKNYFEN